MRTPGIVRKVDELGRIVIPHELRKAMGIHNGDELELCCEGEQLVLRKFHSACVFCGERADLSVYKEKFVCGNCLRNLRKV